MRHLLKTRCYADRLAQRRMGPPPRWAEGTDDGQAALQTDAQRQRLHEVPVRGVGPAGQQLHHAAQAARAHHGTVGQIRQARVAAGYEGVAGILALPDLSLIHI